MSYILGFFAADGYITVNKRGGQFWCIDIKDKYLLEEIKRKIKSNHRISVRKRSNGHITYRLQIGSVKMCDDLRKLGFDERKAKRLKMPKIPDYLLNHFVRGYFDGDGNVWSGKIHKDRKTKTLAIQVVFTSCSEEFLSKLHKDLQKNKVISGKIRKGKGNFFRLVYSINSSLKLYNFMYNGLGTSKLYLKRKKDVFERFITMRS